MVNKTPELKIMCRSGKLYNENLLRDLDTRLWDWAAKHNLGSLVSKMDIARQRPNALCVFGSLDKKGVVLAVAQKIGLPGIPELLFHGIFVHPRYRGRGYAHDVWRTLLEAAYKDGCRLLRASFPEDMISWELLEGVRWLHEEGGRFRLNRYRAKEEGLQMFYSIPPVMTLRTRTTCFPMRSKKTY